MVIMYLAYELNEKAREKASVTLDGEEIFNVRYVDGVYLAKTRRANFSEAIITIKRGSYSMINPFTIQVESDEEIYDIVLILILTAIFTTMATIGLYFFHHVFQKIRDYHEPLTIF